MKKISFLRILFLLLLVACSSSDPDPEPPEPEPPAPPANCIRIGANCKDGTTSTATGSGACSHHGGVASWKYQ
ncbi:MAG TPA: hypothetical protein VFE50_13870 [Cyclobacteriaceae bacterium]|nr:hypothetical protein [Cyclobacteriaceae bacterium]